MGSLYVKFHDDRCKGNVVMQTEPFYLTVRLQTDGRTDGQTDGRMDRVIPVYPPDLVAGGGGGGLFNRGNKNCKANISRVLTPAIFDDHELFIPCSYGPYC